ncbi:MAG: NAD-dependent epimerase/dehydratase family protein [Barnesiella sp.]|nr:NAD-dependent epimerase/dehydratase family protein [Barnesiella sp.]
MKLLITGGTGFLGRYIVPVLRKKYDITLCGITDKDDIQVDLAKEIPMLSDSYDVIFHAAGKAHIIPSTPEEVQSFYDINFQGTKNLCAALEKSGLPKSFIFVSTVAVYGCDEGENIDESHPLNGATPYALSKIKAEQFLEEWCKKNNIILGIIRPSLIAGPNPPGNLGAMISGINTGKYLSIGGGKARKSILMLNDIPILIDLLRKKGGIYNVCDDNHPSFRELEKCISYQLGGKRIISIPYWLANLCAKVGDILGSKAPINTFKLSKITKSLTFSNRKAKEELGWQPTDVLKTFKIS